MIFLLVISAILHFSSAHSRYCAASSDHPWIPLGLRPLPAFECGVGIFCLAGAVWVS